MTSLDEAVAAPLRVPFAELSAAVGVVLGPSRWMSVQQPRIDQFADATDDHQWIHVDRERARSSAYGTTIAHGFLTLSLIAPLLKDMLVVEDVAGALNYGLERVRFPAAVPAGSDVRANGSIRAVHPSAQGVRVVLGLAIEVRGQQKPACVFDLIILYTPAQSR